MPIFFGNQHSLVIHAGNQQWLMQRCLLIDEAVQSGSSFFSSNGFHGKPPWQLFMYKPLAHPSSDRSIKTPLNHHAIVCI
jgi:hypothetical protein